jgi:hypothetical protein
MKYGRWVLGIILLGAVSVALAEAPLTITKALALKLSDRQRRAVLPVDPVEELLVMDRFVAPSAGQKLDAAEYEPAEWQAIQADSTGWFMDSALRGGWIYCAVEVKNPRVFVLEGMGHNMVYVNGAPRIGNRYRAKDTFDAWEPRFDYGLVPVLLQPGKNHLLFRCSRGRLKILLHPAGKPAQLNPRDLTIPDLRQGEDLASWAALPILNTTTTPLTHLYLRGMGDGVKVAEIPLPDMLPLGIRKAGFWLEAPAAETTGPVNLTLTLLQRAPGEQEQILDSVDIPLQRVARTSTFRRTFKSAIDGSIQYYAVNPATASPEDRPLALFFSLHGAGVEGANQASSYAAKSWGHVVAPTNRRPYGHNWEDWGRLDALEVLSLARSTLNIDTSRIYLTGHSMGGHGTWIFSAQWRMDQFLVLRSEGDRRG